ncbi:transcriptional regulator, XRE family protein [Streptomyces sp. SGAir0957]
MPARPTLFRVLLQERRWDRWVVFCTHFERTARELAKETNSPHLAAVSVSRSTFDRWAKGYWFGQPWPDTALVLERLFGVPCSDLFSAAPSVMQVRSSPHSHGDIRAALAITDRWPTSRVFLSGSDEVADSWELAGRQVLDGTTAAIGFRTATFREHTAHIKVADPALKQFLRPARRGVLVGVTEQGDDTQLFVVDAANARRTLAVSSDGDTLALPAAHLLDDLTYGLLWSLVQLDDGLLADDLALAEEQQALDTYLSLPRSAPSRVALPDLTTAGAQWLGSAFCARHIVRRLEGVTAPPVFWTREQTGEQAAPWLWFRHKADYLRALADAYTDAATPMVRVFCIPESEVIRSSRYERILLLLAIALMELYGIKVDVLADPEYSEVDGFALVPRQRAAVANWVRTEAIWAADTVTQRPALRTYHEAFTEAQARSVATGPDPEARLRTLAGFLDVPWPWLVRRCRELSECGTASIVRPRSRHLSVNALDDVFHFLADLAPDR